MTPPAHVLSDLTVLDLSRQLPGAYCTKLLAGLGARVIKVEPPTGDPARARGPFKNDTADPEASGAFLYLNTAKQSITLDLGTEHGAASLSELAEHADVLVEDCPPGATDGSCLGVQALRQRNARLIIASITPFGQDGPYRDYLLTEIVAQALGGLMYTVGLPEREPLKIGGTPALYNAGIAAFTAIMAAVWQRDQTGDGQFIDISIQEATAFTQIHCSIQAAYLGESPSRRPNTMSAASDGWVSLGLEMGVAADIWPRICDLIGRPDLATDPRFSSTIGRRENRDALNDALSGWVAGQSKEQVYHRLQSMRTIAGYVATVEDLFANEHLHARRFFQEVDHPVAGALRYPRLPFSIGEEHGLNGRAPLLGEHNDLVFGGGYSQSAVDPGQPRESPAL